MSVSKGSCPCIRTCRSRYRYFSAAKVTPGKGWAVNRWRIVPFLRPIGANHHHGSCGNRSVAVFPVLDIGDGGLVAGICSDLGSDIDHHQGTQRHGGRDVADRRAVLVQVRRRTELRADVIHGQLVSRDRDALLFVAEGFPFLDHAGDGHARQRGSHLEVRESLADRPAGRDGMRQVDVFGVARESSCRSPRAACRCRLGLRRNAACADRRQRRAQEQCEDPAQASRT